MVIVFQKINLFYHRPSIDVNRPDTLNYDVANLAAFDYSSIDKQKLTNKKELEEYLMVML